MMRSGQKSDSVSLIAKEFSLKNLGIFVGITAPADGLVLRHLLAWSQQSLGPYTMQCHYNEVNFLQNSSKDTP